MFAVQVILAAVVGWPSPVPVATAVPFPAYGTPAPAAVTTVPIAVVAARVDLAQAVAIAAADAPELARARSVLHLARADVAAARTPLAPALGVQATYALGGAEGQLLQQRGATLDVAQLIFDGGRTIAAIRSAGDAADAARGTYRRALQSLAFQVAQAYYGALLARSQVRLQREIVEQDLLQERLIAAQIRAGTAARIDLETAQIPTAQARVAVVRAQGQALAAQAAFANALGLRADARVAPLDAASAGEGVSLPSQVTLDYDRAVARALTMRPDYAAARLQFDASDRAVRAARLGYAPSVTMQAGAGSASYAGIVGWQSTSQASAALDIPLYDRGAVAAMVQQAVARRENARAQLDAARLGVQSDVRQALVQFIAQRAAYDQTADELATASGVLSATQTQYRGGQTTLPLLLNAESQLAGAEMDRLSAQYALRQAEQAYLYALGENDLAEGQQP